MITIEKTVISETEPQVTNVGWFKPSTGELRYFSDGWKSTTPPVASANTLGGVKVGDGLSVTEEGVLSAGSQGAVTYNIASYEGASEEIVHTANNDADLAEAIVAFKQGKRVVLIDSYLNYTQYEAIVCVGDSLYFPYSTELVYIGEGLQSDYPALVLLRWKPLG